MNKDLKSAKEIAFDLLKNFSTESFLKRVLRKQGYSRILSIGKFFNPRWDTLYCIKVAEDENAVLVLFINPKGKGYHAQVTPANRSDGRNA